MFGNIVSDYGVDDVDDGRKTPGRKSAVDVSSLFTASQMTRCPSTNLQYAIPASWVVNTWTVVA